MNFKVFCAFLTILTFSETLTNRNEQLEQYLLKTPFFENPTEIVNSTCGKTLRRSRRELRSYSAAEESLHCPPCEQMHCFKVRKRRLRCRGGTTLDICDCCRVCAKLESELCGGQHNYLGKCDQGLYCEQQAPAIVNYFREGVKRVYSVSRGVCKKVPDKMTADEAYGYICRPKCNPDFCTKNPRAICSAADNAIKAQVCQNRCQHTSCRACRFVEPEQDCPKCATNDFKCFKEFGRCMKRLVCKQRQYPCKNVSANKKFKGKFQCEIPECTAA